MSRRINIQDVKTSGTREMCVIERVLVLVCVL